MSVTVFGNQRERQAYLAGKFLKVLTDESISAGRIGANASVKGE